MKSINASFFFRYFLLPPLLLGTGCIATTMDLDRLQHSIDSVQKSQADFIVKMDELDRSFLKYREELLISQKKISYFSEKLDDNQTIVTQRINQIADLLTAATSQNSAPLPSVLYKGAYGDYLEGHWDLAIQGFESFIEHYPKSVLVPSAIFYIGDCYLTKKEFAQSLDAFDKVLSLSQDLRPQALLKRAYALAGAENLSNEKLTLETLIKEFPESKETQIAKDLLKELSLNASLKPPAPPITPKEKPKHKPSVKRKHSE